MPFVILPGRNKIVAAAWAGLRAEQKRVAKAEAPPAAPAKKVVPKKAVPKKKPPKKGRK